MKRLLSVFAAVLLTALLTGCGGSSGSKQSAEHLYKGYYTGVYSSPSISGLWEFTVNNEGDISGIAEDHNNSYALTGSVDSSGNALVDGITAFSSLRAVGDISFIFNLSSGTITGTWNSGGNSGSLVGLNRTETRPVGNTAPVISGTPQTGVTAGTAYSFTPVSFDADSDPLTFRIANKPSWAEFDNATGTLSGTPQTAATHNGIVISAFDSKGGYDYMLPFGITVNSANTAPEISGTPQTAITAGSAYSFTPTANDADSDNLVFSINLTLPAWLSFSTSTGALTGTPSNSDEGTISNIIINVSDGHGGSDSLTAFSITVNRLNTAPTISGTPAVTVTVGSPYSFIPTASDADTGDTLTFSVNITLPAWLSINSSTGILSGTPTSGDAGTVSSIIITVSDNHGATDSLAAFSITVEPIPVFTVKQTGQTASYADYDDGWYGLGAAPDYTRANDIVSDNATGFMWQDDTDAGDDAARKTLSQAVSYCDNLTLGGYDDWRVPSFRELESIVDYGRNEPTIDPIFQNTAPNSYFLSSSYLSSTLAAQNPGDLLILLFTSGQRFSYMDGSYFVRCVRGDELQSSFTRDNDIVTDAAAGLMWQDDEEAETTFLAWQDAINYCEALTLGAYSGWRLPNIRELHTIIDYGTYSPAVYSVFENTYPSSYWSSTGHAVTTAWRVSFDDGTADISPYTDSFYIRCVHDMTE
ncbi:DUF1566 domain-containing protein [Geovibrio thiophilus]|uniref:DUF1566 domain-containing protein n=1 Tax=Geovibrio thiophilus TaxID=139438 RepID=A0A3R6AYW2_9BACT|nr:DUF1566 domain-containing protein [Geovibrio thiophilus]QAR33716.1 DUF1566 domain-containing protein [Geovibrio thiophilus]